MTMELGCKGRAETIVTSEKTAKTAGSPVVLARFVRMQLGAE